MLTPGIQPALQDAKRMLVSPESSTQGERKARELEQRNISHENNGDQSITMEN